MFSKAGSLSLLEVRALVCSRTLPVLPATLPGAENRTQCVTLLIYTRFKRAGHVEIYITCKSAGHVEICTRCKSAGQVEIHTRCKSAGHVEKGSNGVTPGALHSSTSVQQQLLQSSGADADASLRAGIPKCTQPHGPKKNTETSQSHSEGRRDAARVFRHRCMSISGCLHANLKPPWASGTVVLLVC